MASAKYSVNNHLLEVMLNWVKSKEVAIPEIQRPFVWDSSKVRDLIDSLYNGYPIGYLIIWKNPDVKLKDGSISEGKKILIDGQQRITALSTAVLGEEVINKSYKKVRIKISFNPVEEKFEVQNPAIIKDVKWIPDIYPIVNGDVRTSKVVREFCSKNEGVDETVIEDALENLKDVMKKQIGIIDLDSGLDIETVTDIFIRINSKGAVLSQADFAMSKIASNETYGGNMLRKAIDYFCHLAVAPELFETINSSDNEFTKSEYFRKMTWLKDENDDLYDPEYTDMLRVAFTKEFNRGKLSDLVSLLSGRNFETRTFEEDIAKESFRKLENGIMDFMNETSFKRFLMIVRGAGFIEPWLIRSKNALNFAYVLYLKLKEMNHPKIENLVSRWLVMSILTSRYSGSAESNIDFDIKRINEKGVEEFLKEIEQAELSDAFWNASLVQSLDTSVTSSPFFHVFLASQVKGNDLGFLSKDITVRDMITHRGDIHHLFPKDFLKKQGLPRGKYNQIANYAYAQQEINIKIGNKSVEKYFSEIVESCKNGENKYGAISDINLLKENMKMNCVPQELIESPNMDYSEFLEKRRKLMAEKMRKYYEGL